jgi:CDP-glucose 4,6-dehydratase
MADILSQSLGNINENLAVIIARAGNVIGAWDGSSNRLLPDAVRALEAKEPLTIRHPEAVRPWQHVLDCVGGYWSFVQAVLSKTTEERVLNFAPSPSHVLTVGEVIGIVQAQFPELMVNHQASTLKETSFLTLDSSRARESLGWGEVFTPQAAIDLTLMEVECTNPREEAERQVRLFESLKLVPR